MIVGQIEQLEAGDLEVGDGAGEGVVGEVECGEVGEVVEGGGDRAGEVVVREI